MKQGDESSRLGALPINGLRGSFEGADLRKDERYLAERGVRIHYKDRAMDAWLVDCSERGVRIVLRTPIECDEAFAVEVLLQGSNCLVGYRARYWVTLWAGAYQIGAELDAEVDEAGARMVLRELLAK